MSSTGEKQRSERELKRAEKDARAHLAKIRATDPGKDLPRDQAQAVRSEAIARAREARAQLDAVRAEARAQHEEKQSYFGRMVASLAQEKRRKENAPTPAEAERVQFHAEIAAAQAERNAEALAQRKAAGLVWEPVGPAGGVEAGAVFSSATVWDSMKDEIRDGARHEPTLHARDLVHLWWSLNAVQAGGGSVTIPAGAGKLPPSWPAYDVQAADGIKYREDSIRQLAKLGYLAVEQGAGTLTLTFGPRTKALTDSRRDFA